MRSLLVLPLLLLALVTYAHAQQGGGFLGTLRNFLRPRRQSNFRPQRPPFRVNGFFRRPAARPPPPPPPPPPQNNNNFQDSFAPNTFNAQSSSFNPAPPPQNNVFRQPSSTFNNPSSVRVVNSNNNFGNNNFGNNNNNVVPVVGGRPPQPQPQPQPPQLQLQPRPSAPATNCPSPTGLNRLPPQLPSKNDFRRCAEQEPAPFCPQVEANHFFEGRRYLITWLIDECPGCLCKNFTGQQADEYCQSMGARAVSIDTPTKVKEMERLSARYGQRYFWTGGRMDYPRHSYTWPSGVTTCIQGNSDPWSNTGGWDEKPQPDNRNQLRDRCEPELCIGVLNNFYADGIVWHDVACHHKKPTICEWTN